MKMNLPTPEATEILGQRISSALTGLSGGVSIALHGELGAGKTALARAVIQALGHEGPVVSPTYTLMEPYEVAGRRLCHLDLYRLADPEELDFLGIRDMTAETDDCLLVEWPERGLGYLPTMDIRIELAHDDKGRKAVFTAVTATGELLLSRIQSTL